MNIEITIPPPITIEMESPEAVNVEVGSGEVVEVHIETGPVVIDKDYTIITAIAGEVISGGKAVIIDEDGKVYVYDITNEDHYGKFCGVAKQAANIGAPLQIYIAGIATEVGSGWQPGEVYYVASNGVLTTTIPTSGIIRNIGVGVANDKILINGNLEIVTI